MLRNNIESDFKQLCSETGMTQVQVAASINTTKQYVNRVMKKQKGILNPTFLQMVEALGYDIQFAYVKRNESETNG